MAQLALLEYPSVGQWEVAGEVLGAIVEADREGLGYLR